MLIHFQGSVSVLKKLRRVQPFEWRTKRMYFGKTVLCNIAMNVKCNLNILSSHYKLHFTFIVVLHSTERVPANR